MISKCKITWFILLFLLTMQAHAQSVPASYTQPDLSTDEKRLKWLLTVKENIPDLFKDAANYEIDLMKVLQEQDRIQRKLAENPEYTQIIEKEHAQLLELEVRPKSDQVVRSVQIDPKAIEDWKKNLIKVHENYPSEKKIIEEITSVLKLQKGRTSSGLETGLAMSLPSAERGMIFKASPEEKIKLLEQILPEKISPDFKSSSYGLSLSPGKAEALTLLKELKASEEKLMELTQLHVVLQNGEGRIEEGSLQKLRELNIHDIEFFTDPDALRPRIQKVEALLNQNVGQKLSKNITTDIQKNVKRYTSQTVELAEQLGKRILLKEMPPATAIFRGCVGGDCSTKYSFAFPNAPTEKVFFVYNDKGEVKGYVTGNKILSQGKPSFQVLTIAGPRLSTSDTKLIFEGLEKAKEKLQVEQLVLPNENNLENLVNYSTIREAYKDASEKGARVDIKYLDVDYRKKIETFYSEYNLGFYDKMESNTKGILYKPKSDGPATSVIIKEVPYRHTEIDPEKTKKLAKELCSILFSTGRGKQIGNVLKAAGLSVAEIEELKNVLENKQHLPVDDYTLNIRKMFELSDVEILEVQKRFYKGYLRSPDLHKLLVNEDFKKLFLEEVLYKDLLSKQPYNLDTYSFLLDLDDGRIRHKMMDQFFSKRTSDSPVSRAMREAFKEYINKTKPSIVKRVNQLPALSVSSKGELKLLVYIAGEEAHPELIRHVEDFLKTHSPEKKEALDIFLKSATQSELFETTHGLPVYADYFQNAPLDELSEHFKQLLPEKINLQHQKTFISIIDRLSKADGSNKLVVDSCLQNLTHALMPANSPTRFNLVFDQLLELSKRDEFSDFNKTFAKQMAFQHDDIIKKYIQSSTSSQNLPILLESLKTTQHAKLEELLIEMIKKGDQDLLRRMATAFFQDESSIKMKEAMALLIERADQQSLTFLRNGIFQKTPWIHQTETRDLISQLVKSKSAQCPTLFKTLIK